MMVIIEFGPFNWIRSWSLLLIYLSRSLPTHHLDCGMHVKREHQIVFPHCVWSATHSYCLPLCRPLGQNEVKQWLLTLWACDPFSRSGQDWCDCDNLKVKKFKSGWNEIADFDHWFRRLWLRWDFMNKTVIIWLDFSKTGFFPSGAKNFALLSMF